MNSFKRIVYFLTAILAAMILFLMYLEFKKANQKLQQNVIHSYVNTLEKLDADLDRQVLRMNSWYFSNYDALNQAHTEYMVALRNPPLLPSKLKTAIPNLRQLLDEKFSIIEKLKSNNAVLHNSLNYLPQVADIINDALEQAYQEKTLSLMQVTTLRQYMQRKIFDGVTGQFVNYQRKALGEAPAVDELPANILPLWNNANTHIQVLLDLKQRDWDLNEQLEVLRLQDDLDIMNRFFTEHLEDIDNNQQQRKRWLIVYFLIALMVMLVLTFALQYYRKQHSLHKDQALTEPLTGLGNRRKLEQEVPNYIAQAKLNDSQVGVFFLDLDGFKLVNDTLGHKRGDQLLQEIAAKLKTSLRQNDLVTRIGGDEFVMVVPNANIEILERIALNTLSLCNMKIDHKTEVIEVSASIGVSYYPVDTQQASELIEYADHAMYQAKSDGKSCIRFFSKVRKDL
jgi:diguanylate cyclase (GGDEF)-like protein